MCTQGPNNESETYRNDQGRQFLYMLFNNKKINLWGTDQRTLDFGSFKY